MFRLNVNIMLLTKLITKERIDAVISDVTFKDTAILCMEKELPNEAFDYKHLGIRIVDSVEGAKSEPAEFLYTILVSDTVPTDTKAISCILSPSTPPEYFAFQLNRALYGVIGNYLYHAAWNMLETTTNLAPDLIWYKALDGSHFNVNDAFCYTVSRSKEDIEGRKHAYIWNVSEDEAFACQESEEVTLRENKACSFEEAVNTPDGIKTMITYKTPITTGKGTIIGTAGIARDVTKQRKYESRLHELAMTDFLTGLYNRHKLYREAERVYPGEKTVIYLDLDYFKKINDNYGHEKGDMILKLLSDELKTKFYDGITARMGGDEFVVVMRSDCSDAELQKRFTAMEAGFEASKETAGIGIRFSAGIYRGSLPIDEAIKKADELMYEEKRKHHGDNKE